jgi:hypothetical protein
MRYHEFMSEQTHWDGDTARYVIKQDRTYRTFVGDGKRWSARETDGEIFSGYGAVMAKIAELRAQNPKLKCFSQLVG